MTTHFVGKLLEVRPVETEDKKTNKIHYSTELTVLFEGADESGYLKPSIDAIFADEEDYDTFKDKIGAFVAIPYNLSVNQWGQKWYFDKSMPVLELKENPLDYSKYKRDGKSKKA